MSRKSTTSGASKQGPLKYGLTLSCLDSSLSDILRTGFRVDLKDYLGTAPSFKKYWNFAQETGNPKLYTAEMKESNKLDVLFEKDRLMWYLYLVTLPPSEQTEDDIPLVLRHLDAYLDTCSRAEAGRINFVMYRFISKLTVLHQINSMLKPLRRFYPKMRAFFAEISNRPQWRFCPKTPDEPKLFRTLRRWAMAIRPLSKFKMPTGTRDEAWLSKATSARIVLASLWRKLGEDLTMVWRQAGHLEVDIEILRAMLSQYETTEQLSRWAAEKQRIVSAANSKRWTDHEPLIWEQPDSIEALQDKPRSERLETTSNQDDKPAQDEELTTEAFKNVSIQGSSQSSVNYGQSAPRLMDAQTKREQEKPQPRPHYTLTKPSLNVIQLIFQAGAKIEGQSNGSSSCPSFLKWVLWRYAAQGQRAPLVLTREASPSTSHIRALIWEPQ